MNEDCIHTNSISRFLRHEGPNNSMYFDGVVNSRQQGVLKFFLLLLITFNYINIFGQKEDFNWILGKHVSNPMYWDYNGVNILDFNHETVAINKIPNERFSALSTCSTISKYEGSLLYFSNGMHILNNQFKVIKGGEKINFNTYWNIFHDNYADGSERLLGLKLSQGMLMLPYPGRDSIIWIAHNFQDNGPLIFDNYGKGLFMGIINTAQNKSEVVLKDYLISEDSLTTNGLQACRHANGRDWWITAACRK